MFKVFSTTILILINFYSFGQDASDVLFGIGENVRVENVVVDAQDKVIVAGNYSKNHVDGDLIIGARKFIVPKEGGSFVTKFNERQTIEWFHFIRSYNTPDIKLLTDAAGNVYLVGTFERFIDIDNQHMFIGEMDKQIFVAKFTSAGQLSWVKQLGGYGDESIGKPCVDSQGNIYIVGSFQNNLALSGVSLLVNQNGGTKPFIVKLNGNGDLTWARKYDDEGIEIKAIEVSGGNDVFLAGVFSGKAVFQVDHILESAGLRDVFYVKCAQDGTIQWLKQAGNGEDDQCNDIVLDNNGSLYVGGFVAAGDGYKDALILKVNTDEGDTIWQRLITTDRKVQPDQILMNDLAVNSTGELYVLGYAAGTTLSIDDKPDLTPLAERFIVLAKYSVSGEVKFFNREGLSNHYGYATSMAVDSKRNIYTTNFYTSNGLTNSILKRKTEIDKDNCGTKGLAIVSQESCVGQEMKISENAIILEDDFTFQWLKNEEVVRGETRPSFFAKEEGVYRLRLRGKSNRACIIESVNHIRVVSKEFYAIKVTDIKFQYNEASGALITNGNNDKWYRDGQLMPNTGSSLLLPEDGTYKIKRPVAGCGAIEVESNEIVVKEGATIEIQRGSIDGLGNHCEPFPYFTVKTNVMGEGLIYQWFLNNQPIQDSTKKHLMTISAGDYHVSIIVPHTGKTFVSGKYRIYQRDYLQALHLSKVENGCGSSAIIKIDDAFVNKYYIEDIKWSLNGRELVGEKELFIKAVERGEYTSSLRYRAFYSDKASCEYNSYTVFEKRPDFNVNIGYSYAGSGCSVDSFKVFVQSNPSYRYEWTRNDSTMVNRVSNEVFIKDKAVYKAYVNRGDGCIKESDEISLNGCTSETSDQFLLLNPPVINAGKTSFFVNEQRLIKAEACDDVNFQWLKDGVPMNGATERTLIPEQTGAYSLQIEKAGCVSISNHINIRVEAVLAAEEQLDIEIVAFPNPVEETLQIRMPPTFNSETTLILANVRGEEQKRAIFTNATILSLKDIPEGVYMLRLETDNRSYVRKIVKQYR